MSKLKINKGALINIGVMTVGLAGIVLNGMKEDIERDKFKELIKKEIIEELSKSKE